MEELRKEPVTAGLILLNILVFLIVEFTGSSQNTMHMLDCGAAFTPMIIQGGEYYRLFTCMFLHFGIEHLLNNMLVLFVLGSRLEQVIGKIKFLLIYLIGGVFGNVISLLIELRTQDFAVSAGASGAVFAVMGAMIYIVIRNKGWLGDLSMRQILVMAAFSLYFGFASTGVDNTAHVGGMVSGFFLSSWKKNIKGSTFFRSAFYTECTLVGFNDLPGDSKPEASAPGLVCYEGTKGVFNLVFCHATSVIRDGDLDTVRNGRSGKKDFAVSMLDRFLRITEKVKKSLTDFCLIQTDLGKITGDVSLKGDSKVVQCRSKGTGNSIQADT